MGPRVHTLPGSLEVPGECVIAQGHLSNTHVASTYFLVGSLNVQHSIKERVIAGESDVQTGGEGRAYEGQRGLHLVWLVLTQQPSSVVGPVAGDLSPCWPCALQHPPPQNQALCGGQGASTESLSFPVSLGR